MNLEKQVCTKTQSQKLYDLGIRGESLFYYTQSDWGIMPKKSIDFNNGYVLNAFTVAELGLMIPSNILLPRLVSETFVEPGQSVGKWAFYDRGTSWTNCDTEAQARAQLLIDLIEVCGICIKEINQRLQAA